MKNWKLTPFLITYPLLIALFVLYVYSQVWTPFSMVFIIGFIIIISLVLLLERLVIRGMSMKKIWIVESILELLLTIFSLYYIL